MGWVKDKSVLSTSCLTLPILVRKYILYCLYILSLVYKFQSLVGFILGNLEKWWSLGGRSRLPLKPAWQGHIALLQSPRINDPFDLYYFEKFRKGVITWWGKYHSCQLGMGTLPYCSALGWIIPLIHFFHYESILPCLVLYTYFDTTKALQFDIFS